MSAQAGLPGTQTRNRLFYHSFPRRWRSMGAESYEKGLLILDSILRFGLLLTPEIVKFERKFLPSKKPGEDLKILQIRFCFTQLNPDLLRGHTEVFGPFTVAFEERFVRALGAIPVIYIPTPREDAGDLFSVLGYAFVEKLAEVKFLLEQLASLQQAVTSVGSEECISVSDGNQTIRLKSTDVKDLLQLANLGNDNYAELCSSIQALSCIFYPTGRLGQVEPTDELEFYFEREWRIISDVVNDGRRVDSALSEDEAQTTVQIDSTTASCVVNFASRKVPYLQCCRIVRSVLGQPIKSHIKQIIVPRQMKPQVMQIARRHDFAGEIVELST